MGIEECSTVQAHVKVVAVFCDEDKVRRAGPGENVRVRLSGIEEEEIISGFVLSSVGKVFSFLVPFHNLHKLQAFLL